MIALFTDFGVHGPYVGQMKAVLMREAPEVPVLDLMHDAPSFDAQASAYLLAALVNGLPSGTVFLAVVDPGVGDAKRRPVILQAGDKWFVGPDNGLFNIVARRQTDAVEWHEILWRPEALSSSFHGRDLFAPVAAALSRGNMLHSQRLDQPLVLDWPDDLARIVYIDDFGNAMTGLRADQLGVDVQLQLGESVFRRADTFSDVPAGQGFWYENSSGLAEIAVNRGHAADVLHLSRGQKIQIRRDTSDRAMTGIKD